jgi:hypothetical protein
MEAPFGASIFYTGADAQVNARGHPGTSFGQGYPLLLLVLKNVTKPL